MILEIPEFSFVVLVGVSGSGKSTFAAKHFASTEVLSSDSFRGIVADDPDDQSATSDAFDALHHIAGIRLRGRRLTVLDATNTQREARREAIAVARAHHALCVAIVLDVPAKLCIERSKTRPNRRFAPRVVPQQASQLRRSLRGLRREGFHRVHVLKSVEDIESVQIERQPLWTDKRAEHGPFDIVGDVHGCFDELRSLVDKLGYGVREVATGGENDSARDFEITPPEGRKLLFVGDLVDRGPKSPDVLRFVHRACADGYALCVAGNHDVKLQRKLKGKDVRIAHGLAETLEQLESETPEFREEMREFLYKLVSHYVLDDGKLVVAHAGLREDLQGRASAVVRSFALYGDTTGEIDEFGLPVRHPWAKEYRGDAMVVYGHTPVPEAEWLNRTICVDTGCVFGGKLTALRYPELELVSVPARATYYEPMRPLEAEASDRSAQQENDDLLHAEDVRGKRIVQTRLRPNITIRDENAMAALEVMSRFAIDPRLLIYLPPTMAPSESSARDGYLEYPEEAFASFRKHGVQRVVCEEKHMGSRAIVVVARDEAALAARFGIEHGLGTCYTRTGRAFFHDAALEAAFLQRVRDAALESGLFDELATDWLCLDCELMPWSAKARALIAEQYAPVGDAGALGLKASLEALATAAARGAEVGDLRARVEERLAKIRRYVDAYEHYCWPVHSLEDYRLAPFHLLASEGACHVDRDHVWHMTQLARLAQADPQMHIATPHLVIELSDDAPSERSTHAACAWWDEQTSGGGEGMVIKPLDFVSKGPKGLVQPALKCRGPEYLRIIYGPEYDAEEKLARLRKRSTARKRSLALREFVLGIEALERFVRREPLRRVHECVFGVLALESEAVDPRL